MHGRRNVSDRIRLHSQLARGWCARLSRCWNSLPLTVRLTDCPLDAGHCRPALTLLPVRLVFRNYFLAKPVHVERLVEALQAAHAAIHSHEPAPTASPAADSTQTFQSP